MENNWFVYEGDNGINGIFNTAKKHQRDDALVPFKTKVDKNLYEDFSGVVGAFSRLMSGTILKKGNIKTEVYENMRKKVEDVSDDDFNKLFSIIEDLYFDSDKLIPINTRALNYISSNITQQQIAEYLYSLFVEPNRLTEYYKRMTVSEDSNILEKLLFESLSDNEDSDIVYQHADCFLPYVNEAFKKDYIVLTENRELYKTYINRFLAYYYMFYVTQLAVKLSRFENGNRDEIEKIFMTLTWEVVTKVRPGYEYGWKFVKDKLSHMFSHSVLMEMLAHNVDNKHMDYIEFYNTYVDTDMDQKIAQEIHGIIEKYKEWIPMDYENCKYTIPEKKCYTSDAVRKLYETIDYQFIYGGRKSHYNGYNKKFIEFVQKNFGKSRGSMGYTLSLNENDLIMFTKIVLLQYDGRIKLSMLYKELENRGLLFDRESKKEITELFEKMDLLEKRSDSGDAQYVKYVL